MAPSIWTLPDRAFRYRLTLMVWSVDRTVSVAELVAALEAAGVPVKGRPSKVVSDALRWEVRRGRLRRVGRGLYRPGRMPTSTKAWMRSQVRAADQLTGSSYGV